jgi:hypothetical protein
MINHPTLQPTLYPPYAYFPPSNYLSKPMPLMGTTNSCSQSGPTFILPPDLANSAFFRNQTFPSPPPSTSSSARTNNNNNSTQYQNGNNNNNNNKLNNDLPLASNDSSKTHSTPIRSKPR